MIHADVGDDHMQCEMLPDERKTQLGADRTQDAKAGLLPRATGEQGRYLIDG